MAKGTKSAKSAKRDGKAKKKASTQLTAATADKHRLYEIAVQAPDFEVDLLTSVFKRRVGRRPLSLREDFCGTAYLCAEWVASHPQRTATGIDIDASVLAWGRENHLAPIGDDAKRVTLIHGDVRDGGGPKHDIIVAFNYACCFFKDRATVRGYFESIIPYLKPDGLFFIDQFGGWEAQQVQEEERKYKGFRYVWHQAYFNPIDHAMKCHIHFRFPDGSKMEPAFSYDWRLWTLPELRELLEEAGFRHVECLWEEDGDDGLGNGVFRPRKKVRNDPSYNAYLVASLTPPPEKKAAPIKSP